MPIFFMENIFPAYVITLLIISSYFFIMSLANHYEMWRFSMASEIFDGPMVSVLVPARNEEENIEDCLKSLQSQIYKNYEILVLNDNSTDNTLEILNRISAKDSRVRVFNGKPLPADWYGKPYALHQLTQEAKGDIFILTDADTIHTPTSIAWSVTNMFKLKADLVSGYIGQVFKSFGEIITVPLMFFLTGFIIPLFINRFTKVSWFAVAIGQFIAIKRNVFEAIGGCESFKKKTSEDVYMCRLVKNKGYKTFFLNVTEHVKCHMYEGYHNAIEGIGKNIYDFLGKSTVLIFFILFIIIVFLLSPFFLMFLSLIFYSQWTVSIIAAVGLHTLTWLFMFLGQKLNWWYCFLWPIMIGNLIYMAVWSWFRTISGKGFLWKDRFVS